MDVIVVNMFNQFFLSSELLAAVRPMTVGLDEVRFVVLIVVVVPIVLAFQFGLIQS